MTDDELMRALYAEGMSTYTIARKFETTAKHVNQVLGLRGLDPRSVRLYQRFMATVGDDVVTATEIKERQGRSLGAVWVTLTALEERGHIQRVGLDPRRQVLWQMVRIDELLPAEPVAA